MIDQYDIETEVMASIASALTLQQKMFWPQIRRGIMDRVAQFQAGRQQAPDWLRKQLKAYDSYLDIRWSFDPAEPGWIIERYSRGDRAWVPVLVWNDLLDNRVIETLMEGDIWRYPSIEAFVKHKREKSARIREQNRKRSQERLAEAIDSLTEKQATEFMEVERALRYGETVEFHGESGKIMDRMIEGERRARASGMWVDTNKIKTFRSRRRAPRIQ